MTVEEALKAAGMNDEEIGKLDARAREGLSKVTEQANQAAAEAAAKLEQASLEKRATKEYFDTQITPALNDWGNRETNLNAEVAYYKTLAEKAKDGGFVADAPPFKPATATPGANPVPGSPQIDMNAVRNDMGTMFSTYSWANREYAQTHGGQMLPDDFEQIAAEASQKKLGFKDYFNQKYDIPSKRAAQQQAARQAEIDTAVKTAVQAKEREYAERGGSNPNIRPAEQSGFSQVARAVADGKRPDPLKFKNENERRASTRANIHADIAAQNSTIQ